jgi:hypothetical protein
LKRWRGNTFLTRHCIAFKKLADCYGPDLVNRTRNLSIQKNIKITRKNTEIIRYGFIADLEYKDALKNCTPKRFQGETPWAGIDRAVDHRFIV